MAKEKLEYEVEFPISVKGQKKALKDMEKLEKSFIKFARNAQAASARINLGALAKSGTLGRTVSNIATKNLTDFMPHKSFARAGANIGSSFGKKMWGADMAADYAEKYQLNRLAKGKSLTSKVAMTGVNKAAGRGMVAAGAKGAAMGGMAGGALGGALMLLPAVIGLIVASSRMLQKTLGNIMKYLLMFLRPIGDMLAVLFYPLMMILRPMALLVNTLIRPFLQTARQWFRVGLKQQRMAKDAKEAGFDTDVVTGLEDMAKASFGKGLAVLGLGLSSFFSEIFAQLYSMLVGIFTDIIGALPGMKDAMAEIKAQLLGGIDAWKTNIQDANKLALYKSQQELEAVKAVNENIEGYIELVNRAKLNGQDYKKIIEETSPAIIAIAATYVKEGGIAALTIANEWAKSLTSMLMGLGILDGANLVFWKNQLGNIQNANNKFVEMFNTIQTKIDELTGKNSNKEKPKGNALTKIFGGIGLGSTAIVDTLMSLSEAAGLSKSDREQFDRLYAMTNSMMSGYDLDQSTRVAWGDSLTLPSDTPKEPSEFIDISSVMGGGFEDFQKQLSDLGTQQLNDFSIVSESAEQTALSMGNLQTATEELHGFGGHGFVELQQEVASYMELVLKLSEITGINTFEMQNFSSAITYTINAMYSALGQAQAAAKSAQESAKAAASSASQAKSSSSGSSLLSKIFGGKASGGLVSENGMYYLHKGENVTNPVSSSFNNTAGSSNSLPSIEFNNCNFGSTEDWKKKMDEYFNKQMRHIR